MSDAIIRRLLEVRLNAVSGGFSTAFENAPFRPVTGVPYQQVWLMPGQTQAPTLPAGGLKREVGFLQVSLFYPENEGSANAAARAEAIKAQFPHGLVLTEGAVRLTVDLPPYTSRGFQDGGRYVLPLTIPYRADVTS